MTDLPTADQFRAYLHATGWEVDQAGAAASMWVRHGQSIRLLNDPAEWDIGQAVFELAIAEDRHPADVRLDIIAGTLAADDGTVPDLLANLPAMIKAELARRRMSQRDFATEVVASPSTITRLLAKKQMCDAATLVRICAWLRIEPADLADERVNEAYRRGRSDVLAEIAAVVEGGLHA